MVKRFSHLWYCDDTLIIDEKSWSNTSTIKINLTLFEIMSDLKVNFHKNLLVGINIPQHLIEEATNVLNCKSGSSTFTYLGLPIGVNSIRKAMWKPL